MHEIAECYRLCNGVQLDRVAIILNGLREVDCARALVDLVDDSQGEHLEGLVGILVDTRHVRIGIRIVGLDLDRSAHGSHNQSTALSLRANCFDTIWRQRIYRM